MALARGGYACVERPLTRSVPHSVDGLYVTVDGKRALNMASANFLCLGGTPETLVSVEFGVWN